MVMLLGIARSKLAIIGSRLMLGVGVRWRGVQHPIQVLDGLGPAEWLYPRKTIVHVDELTEIATG